MNQPESSSDPYQHAISMLQGGSLDLGIKKLELLSEKGDGHADAVLGALFEFGKGKVSIDQRRALIHYEKSISSVGSLQGWMGLGRISLYGSAELRDPQKAFECFSLVAHNSDYPQAWLALAEMYLYGQGTSVDTSMAVKCFQRAIDLGNILGYRGLAKAAALEGRYISSIKYRASAFFLALQAIRNFPRGRERLQKW